MCDELNHPTLGQVKSVSSKGEHWNCVVSAATGRMFQVRCSVRTFMYISWGGGGGGGGVSGSTHSPVIKACIPRKLHVH